MPDKNVDDVIAIKGAGVAHELLRSEILLHPCKTKLLRGHVDPVAGERTCRCANVILGVIANSDGEKLHQLARPILVRMRFAVLLKIEINHHRRVARNRFDQCGKIPKRVSTERVVLQPHPVTVFDFLNACSEMTVPEKSHLLQKRRRAIHHSLEPPAAEIENLISLHHAELPCRFAKIFAALLCGFERHPRCANVTRLRPGGRRNISRIGAHIDKFSHHGDETLLSRALDFSWRGTKPRPVQKMGRSLIVP